MVSFRFLIAHAKKREFHLQLGVGMKTGRFRFGFRLTPTNWVDIQRISNPKLNLRVKRVRSNLILLIF